jgi:integrase
MLSPDSLARLPFDQAAAVWLDSHRRNIGLASIAEYGKNIKRLTVFFSGLTLAEIHIGHLEQYQHHRCEGEGFGRKAGPSRINHELNTLSQILTRAGLWAPFAPYYKPLKMPRPSTGQALTDGQEENLFRIACSRPRWKVAYLCSLLTANTTAGPGEIRMLRMRDVDLAPTLATPYGTITVALGAKNSYRVRTIPLNETAGEAARQLVSRARELGAVDANHFLLPHRANSNKNYSDPTHPQTSWKKAWDKLRKAAGMPQLRMYDLRHHVITRLLEDENVSERTVIELAGHVSKKMLDTYSHIRMKSKLDGVLALDRAREKRKPQGTVGFGQASPREKIQ